MVSLGVVCSCERLARTLAVGWETSTSGNGALARGHEHRPGSPGLVGIARRLNPSGILVSPGPGASPACLPHLPGQLRPSLRCLSCPCALSGFSLLGKRGQPGSACAHAHIRIPAESAPCRPSQALRRTRGSRCRLCVSWAPSTPSSACAWGISASARCSEVCVCVRVLCRLRPALIRPSPLAFPSKPLALTKAVDQNPLAFAGDIVRAQSGVMHGKTSPVTHIDAGVLQGLAMCAPLPFLPPSPRVLLVIIPTSCVGQCHTRCNIRIAYLLLLSFHQH